MENTVNTINNFIVHLEKNKHVRKNKNRNSTSQIIKG